ncbi:MAG: aminomethyltransferase beta-barrel domain-containing protein, partial [Planctomycetota bacterium]
FGRLIDYFCSEYDQGRTPNPCIRCNQYLKFGKLLEYADKLGADYIATGHYARITSPQRAQRTQGIHVLRKGVDITKDQSYVLFTLSQQQLARIIFPLGEMTKKEVRRIAHRIDLPVKDKPESQDVCFVPSSGYQNLLKERIPDRLKTGKVKDTSGKVIGKHDGFQLFTIGQRRGLRIAMGRPAYVSRIIPKTNTVILGDRSDVLNTTFVADEVNWVNAGPPEAPPLGRASPSGGGLRASNSPCGVKLALRKSLKTLDAEVKIRYLHKQSKAKIKILGNKRVEVRFRQPQFAITPGQAAVFYKGDTVLGGGWIKSVK